MTDTPSSGAGADARVHGDPAAIAQLDVVHMSRPLPLSPAEAEALLGQPTLSPSAALAHDGQAPPAATVLVDLRQLKPWATALVRWLMHGVGVWLIAHGMSQARAGDLEPILTGLACSLGALAWSCAQKRLQAIRLERAARASPSAVVLRR